MDKPIIDQSVLERLQAIVGDKGCITDPADMMPYLREERSLFEGRSPMIVRPANTREVADVVALCAETKTALVPQGGNTSLCGASTPHDHNGEIVLSLSRMNEIPEIDALNYTMTAQAGCILQNLQEAAVEAGRLFPLDLGARGTCEIGGNLSTNAGGLNVLRYGMARDLVLGLEVVLPDGRIWNGLNTLRKDNTGYDLKQLFIGAEGTLGIITTVNLKLFPLPSETQTALFAVRDVQAAIELFARAREVTGDLVSGFELMPRAGFDLVFENIPDTRDPMAARYDWYVLIELSSAQNDAPLQEMLETLFGEGMDKGQVLDGVIASSQGQADELWEIRDSLPEAQKYKKGAAKHDVSVPISRIPDYIEACNRAVEKIVPGAEPFAFGHIGDGNIHFNYLCPDDMEGPDFMARRQDINRTVYECTAEFGGSISAEHGIGRLKMADLTAYKSEVEIDLMRRIKRELDPDNIMNPGKVVDMGS